MRGMLVIPVVYLPESEPRNAGAHPYQLQGIVATHTHHTRREAALFGTIGGKGKQ